jgi:hypothetical protein
MGNRVPWAQAVSPLSRVNEEATETRLPATSLLDRFAEHLSDHGDIELAAAAIRVPLGTGEALFETLCRRLGWQAR